MTRALTLALVLVAALLAACGAPARLAPPRLDGAAQAQTATAVVIGVVIREGTHDAIVCLPDVQDCPLVAPEGPAATPTPVATAIPTQPLTNTPRPSPPATLSITLTPSAIPTSLSTPTATAPPVTTQAPTEAKTPTPQGTVATTTPAPTPVITCELKLNRTVNVRNGPALTNGIVGSAALGTNISVQRFAVGTPYLWAQIGVGRWVAVYDYNAAAWWADGSVDAERCVDVPGWPPNLTPPEAIAAPAALAFHVVPGVNRSELGQAWEVLRAAGIPFGVKAAHEPFACQQTIAAGGICVYRDLVVGDCPNVRAPDPAAEARRWLMGIDSNVRAIQPSMVEISNECDYSTTLLAQFWDPFVLEAVRYARALGWPPLVAPTFGPGYPLEDWHLDLIAPALRALRDSGGALGLHNYAVDENGRKLCGGSDWLSYRHRRTYRKLVEMGLGSLRLALTEVGEGWGGEVPDEADLACYYQDVKGDPGVILVAFWNAGTLGNPLWELSQLNGHLLSLARRVAALP